MSKYSVHIAWSEEDAAYIARAPELPGCVAHGDSQSQALHNLQQAIALWVDTAREAGRPVPPPQSTDSLQG